MLGVACGSLGFDLAINAVEGLVGLSGKPEHEGQAARYEERCDTANQEPVGVHAACPNGWLITAVGRSPSTVGRNGPVIIVRYAKCALILSKDSGPTPTRSVFSDEGAWSCQVACQCFWMRFPNTTFGTVECISPWGRSASPCQFTFTSRALPEGRELSGNGNASGQEKSSPSPVIRVALLPSWALADIRLLGPSAQPSKGRQP